jgi:DNA-binding NarL/FixJ family response regulator
MIVDDDGYMRKKMREIVENHGYLVVGEVADGSSAAHFLEYLRPDMVLMDIVMKEMDGATATRSIKQRFPEVQVLMVSSLGKGNIVRGALAAGACGFVKKPFTDEQLLEAMDRGLNPAPEADAPPAPAPIKKILVVDDDLYMRRKVCKLIEMHELGRVFEAEDGAQAVDISYQLQPDLVIMDIVMKEMDGVKATAMIRKIAPKARVLAVSSLKKSEVIISCLRAGACDYVSKPIDETRFLKTMRHALEAHARQGGLELPEDSEARAAAQQPASPRVMIVDDDVMMRRMMGKLLERAGCRVAGEFDSAEHALRHAAQLNPDVVLMDLMMGGMNGAVATQELKRTLPHAKVIVVSAIAEAGVIDGCMAHGAMDYLTKPFDNNSLVRAIKRAMNAHLS